MIENIVELSSIRIEISFKSYEELRYLLSFYQKNCLYKINIPCKNSLKKEFLLNSIKISREEYPNIDLVPHFSILHEFKRNRLNTLNSFVQFLENVKGFGCKEVLLVSGSQKRSTLDSVSTLRHLKNNILFSKNDFSIGVAFNPYLPSFLFKEEIVKLEEKLHSGLVRSIWIQFGTDYELLESRIEILKKIIFTKKSKFREFNINLFGSLLIPSKQFLARFRYRPWKGVYCSEDFLNSEVFAYNIIRNILHIYRKNKIYPIIETDVSTQRKLNKLMEII
tara:strand:- start:22 stop:858 length:837 start_codon:yes stop_codon:yes gene_type:complete